LPTAQFSDTRSTFQEISLGTGWTHRRTPSLLDVGQATIVMWGGRHSTLWSQPFGPFENPLEMNSSRLFVAQRIATHYAKPYELVFGQGSLGDLATATRIPSLAPEATGCKLTSPVDRPRALPPDPIYECHGVPGDGAEYDRLSAADKELVTRTVVNVGKAMAAYERQLVCGQGRFDAWVAGDRAALTPAEQRGALLFVGKGKCSTCHSGPYLSDQKFHNVGLKVVATKEGILNGNDNGAQSDLQAARDDEVGILGKYSDGDDGRLPADVDDSYLGAFRTPTLRCVNQRPSFMHTGTMHTLEAVVAFFNQGGDKSGFPGTNVLEKLALSGSEMSDLVAFLKALDGPGPDTTLLGPAPDVVAE
jgi:cytochrome c peroxidase